RVRRISCLQAVAEMAFRTFEVRSAAQLAAEHDVYLRSYRNASPKLHFHTAIWPLPIELLRSGGNVSGHSGGVWRRHVYHLHVNRTCDAGGAIACCKKRGPDRPQRYIPA